MAKEDTAMIEIQFSTLRRHDGEPEWDHVATIRVDGVQFELVGDEAFAEVRDIEVLDVESGQSVTYDAHPERWARNLPQAFRSGDLRCEIAYDSAADSTAREPDAAHA
jgi:hypothetical protein